MQVVAQTDNLPQTINVVAETPADVILFEAGLSPTPAEAISEVARRALPGAKLILVTQRAGEQETVDYLRRGVRGILTRAVSPDLLVRCVRKVAAGETWLDKQGVNWVIEAYRSQALQGAAPKQQLRLSEKEMLIISGVTQGIEEQRHCSRGRHHRAGGEELSAQDLRQASGRRPPGISAVQHASSSVGWLCRCVPHAKRSPSRLRMPRESSAEPPRPRAIRRPPRSWSRLDHDQPSAPPKHDFNSNDH